MRLKSWIRLFVVFLLFEVLSFSISSAQVSHGGMPCPERLLKASLHRPSPGHSSDARVSSQLPYVEMPSFSVDSLLREDLLSSFGAQRFANKFKVSIDMENSGTISYLEDGTKVWRVGITSKDALSLNLLFTEYEIPSQAKVFVYSPDRSTILGSFTAQNRQKSGILPIAPIEGDSLIVEYVEPAGADFEGRLRVGEVNHDYVGLRLLPSKLQSKECEVDVNCDERSSLPQKRSVCLITISGTYYCSGALVNNTAEDDAPYVLSASHCLFADGSHHPVDESLAETCVFFFNYETPFCYSDVKGTMEQTVAGASVAVSNYKYDMLLFRLSESVPVDYRPYYSGWNVSDELRPPFYMIHHPSGDLKKISVEKNMVYTASFYTTEFLANSHWHVDLWESGISEGGSSGSPLFDADNRIVGALSGGDPGISCTQRGYDNFYKLLLPWNNPKADDQKISTWLDPMQKGTLLLDGKEANGNPCVRISNIRSTDHLLPSEESKDGYASGHNSYGYLRYAEKFVSEGLSRIYGVYFVPFSGSYSEDSPVKLSIYSGKDEPTNLLHEQVVKISNTEYSYSTQKISTSLAKSWVNKENYLRLDSVVSVEGNFFVVFDLPEKFEHKFALRYADERLDDVNTAYFFHDGAWHTFRENELVKKGSSLMVDVVCQCSVDASQVDVAQKRRTSATMGEDGEVYLFFEIGKGGKQVLMYDMYGRLLEDKKVENDWCRMEAPHGIVMIRVIYEDYSDTLKLVR
ncbi:MAG: trypsin-like peptidase domain-containing protein [Paludibacteraceae bacterium]|nr:trypsin-like peptidase domain-containing protein [Paludibacteraceae bacterium]